MKFYLLYWLYNFYVEDFKSEYLGEFFYDFMIFSEQKKCMYVPGWE